MTVSVISVPGLGPKTAEYLEKQGITTAEALLEAGLDALVAAPGFGDSRARKVMDTAATMVVDAEERIKPQEKMMKTTSCCSTPASLTSPCWCISLTA